MRIGFAISLGLAVLAGSILSGCAGPTSVGVPYRRAATWSVMTYAASRGPMLVEVIGDPFGIGEGALAGITAAAMTDQVPTYPFPLTADRARAPEPNIRVVVAFDPGITASGAELCQGKRPMAAGSQAGWVQVLAAFCDRGVEMSSVQGQTPADGPRDPRLRFLLAQMTRQLFGDNTEMLKSGPNGGFH
ncbi:MAG: hypothetical protein M0006_17495 [Magnetospirillum sp.]|nr:hypothetical protein [Magnetospirillum sp.]